MMKTNTASGVVGIRFRRLIATGLMVGISVSAPAFAQSAKSSKSGSGTKASAPSPEETKRVLGLIRTANDAFDSEDYERAYDLYLEASQVYPQPVIFYRLGLSAEKTGRTREAVEHYEALLALDAGSDSAKDVRSRLPELRAILPAKVRIDSSPSGASVHLGANSEKFVGKTPVEVEVKPGEATFVVSFPSHKSEQKTVKLEAGSDQKLNFELVESDEADDEVAQAGAVEGMDELGNRRTKTEAGVVGTEPRLKEKTVEVEPVVVEKESDGSTMQVWSWVLIGTGVAAVAGGGVLNFLQNNKTDDVNTYNKRAPGATPGELQDMKDSANTLHTWSLVSYITGGVLVAAGAGLLTYDLLKNNEDAASARGLQMGLDVGVAAGGGWLGVNGRF